MNYIVQTESLTKKYGDRKALDNVNINIKEGTIYGLVGRNGAGKTTLMKIICSLTQRSKGKVVYNNISKKDLGILIESPGLYQDMTALENLNYF